MSAQLSEQRQPVEINAGKSSPLVEIVWDDGHRSPYQVNQLRAICPCATCREAAGDPDHKTNITKSPEVSKRRSLPMFKAEKFQITNMSYVGRYALGVTWQDKHQSIYPWALLNEECPCPQCQARRAAAPPANEE